MRRYPVIFAALIALFATAPPRTLAATETPESRGRAIEEMVGTSGSAALDTFAEEHLAPRYRDPFAPGALRELLERIRVACAGAGGITADRIPGGGIRLSFERETESRSVVFRLEESAPHRIVSLELEDPRKVDRGGADVGPISWDALEQRLEEEEARGFSGSVLMVRGGKVVLDRGYGLADRETRRPIDRETIFAIGSLPIAFTHAAILRLAEGGALDTSDPITRFFRDVPADKRGITIEHLLSGRSGLPDFHHLDQVDPDPDLTWIDRNTAVRRILGQKLLFRPGEGDAHSHSAWVLLAAIVERVSGQRYGEYLRTHFFKPAGMKRTGLHQDASRFKDEDFAIGYEGQSVGKRNTPKYWGRTSWLVMGSGGMMSTPGDLRRWLDAILRGKTLSEESAARYLERRVALGGDDRGFLCVVGVGTDDMAILCSNSHSRPGDRASAIGRRLVQLVTSETRASPSSRR